MKWTSSVSTDGKKITVKTLLDLHFPAVSLRQNSAIPEAVIKTICKGFLAMMGDYLCVLLQIRRMTQVKKQQVSLHAGKSGSLCLTLVSSGQVC